MRHRGSVILLTAIALIALGMPMAAAQETVLYSFVYGTSDGLNPNSNLIPDGKGNFYGTTEYGGSVGSPYNFDGTVFELSPKSGGGWTETVLYSFGVVSGDGIQPVAGLVFDSAGNLYGTTLSGGAHNEGTVFELSPQSGGGWTEKILYSFGATATDANSPRRGTLVFDAKGNLYGTTNQGGTNGASPGDGAVFELSPGTGGVWTEKVIYSFGANTTDGLNPRSGVVFDAAGHLYGTTYAGGPYSCGTSTCGTVYELTPGSGSTWTEKILHNFNLNDVDGANPVGGVIFDGQGNLYGTTYYGGNYGNGNHLGAVYELSPTVEGTWTEEVLYSFTGTNGDGASPTSDLIFDQAGNLYGTTEFGGAAISSEGTVFKLTRGSSGWNESILYAFSGALSDGHNPVAAVNFDAAGNLYGTTSAGGTNSAGQYGTIFQLASIVTAAPQFSPPGGAYSSSQNVSLSDSTANATIYYKINGSSSPVQYTEAIKVSSSETITAYAISPSLPQSQPSVANYQIGGTAATPWFSPAAGTYSAAQLVTINDAAPGATIYYTTNGTTPTTSSTKYTSPISVTTTETIEALAVASGYSNSAVASAKYTITPVVPPAEKVLYNFSATSDDGGVPLDNLVADGSGNLYGTTKFGGPNEVTYAGNQVSAGTAFELVKSGSTYTEKIIYNFGASTSDGALPIANMVFDSKGNLYGTTFAGGAYGLGTVFELSLSGGNWTEKIIYSFGVSLADGKIPEAGVIFDSKGNLYGTTSVGGTSDTTYGGGYGTVFELSPSGSTWTETVLWNFSYLSQTDGYFPESNLVFDSSGNLYGTTADGGTGQDLEGGGTIFELVPQGGGGWTEKVLYNFGGGGPQGYLITGGVVLDSAGNIYGVAHSGGNGYGLDGTLFELSPAGGSAWTFQVLHSFGAYETDGINPNASLIFDSAGDLYGTTYAGGAYGYGTVFEMTPQTGGGWIESVVHSFDLVSTDGANPSASLILDGSGNLYGTAAYGGSHGNGNNGQIGGTVFEIVNSTTTNYKLTVTAAGTGSGSVSSSPSGIACPGTCSASFASGTVVTLTEAANSGSTFAGWGGACSGTGSCKVTMSTAESVTATFNSSSAPAVKLSATSLNFGSIGENETTPAKVVTLTNTGTAALSISSIAITGTNTADFGQTNTCGSSVAANASCTISVTFTPKTTGALTAAVSVTDNASGSPQTIALSGTGTTAKLSPLSLSFGSIGENETTPAKTVTLTNLGTTAMTISSISITGTNAADYAETNTCGTSLAASASCTISVTFTPNVIGVLSSASLSVSDNATGSPQKVSLSGTGTTAKLSPLSLSFGSIGENETTPAKTVTLTNLGTTAMTISSISITGTDAADYAQTSTCSTSLAASANCTISVTFKPNTTGVLSSASLSVSDNATGSPQKVSLSGTGTTAKLSPLSLSFGTVTVGSKSAAKTVTLTNGGTSALAITSITITGTNASDFAETNTCGSSLAASASCTISVTFTPGATGSRSAAISVTDNAIGSPQKVTLSGTGG
ncbi:MAG TPA: choice-of-anchor tandem repeat GloVer-containing protein [Verrucomicrobiae bacterium]|nr:choice-of-anchor tandem repeat GloVer-containing protein [Verrucomicrobiae bacterium]